jgi:aspartate racemase
MRTLGLIGGLTWQSTSLYYRLLNENIANAGGGLTSAPLLIDSLDFAPIARLQSEGRWEEAGEVLAQAAVGLERAGAQALLICANTMHKVAPQIEAAVGIPLIHVADVTADAVLATGATEVAVLGTRYTLEQPFLLDRFRGRGLTVEVPDKPGRDLVHRVIYEELAKGRFDDGSRREIVAIIEAMVEAGRQAVILACTELELLVSQDDVSVPCFPTTALHAAAGAAFILGEA